MSEKQDLLCFSMVKNSQKFIFFLWSKSKFETISLCESLRKLYVPRWPNLECHKPSLDPLRQPPPTKSCSPRFQHSKTEPLLCHAFDRHTLHTEYKIHLLSVDGGQSLPLRHCSSIRKDESFDCVCVFFLFCCLNSGQEFLKCPSL